MGKSVLCDAGLIFLGTKKMFLLRAALLLTLSECLCHSIMGWAFQTPTSSKGQCLYEKAVDSWALPPSQPSPAHWRTGESGVVRASAVCMSLAAVWVHVAFIVVSGKHAPYVELLWFKYRARQSCKCLYILNKAEDAVSLLVAFNCKHWGLIYWTFVLFGEKKSLKG